MRIPDDRAKKSWCFDQVAANYGEPGWTVELGYPLRDRILLHEQQVEIVTGKPREGLYH